MLRIGGGNIQDFRKPKRQHAAGSQGGVAQDILATGVYEGGEGRGVLVEVQSTVQGLGWNDVVDLHHWHGGTVAAEGEKSREKSRGRKVEGEKSREKGLLDGGGRWQVLLVLRLLPG